MTNTPQADQNGPWRRAGVVILICLAVLIGVLSVKRIINGNGDLNGNYKIWRANLIEPTQPGPHLSHLPGLEDPDSYPPITYALLAPFAMLPLPLLAVVWYLINLACTWYLWSVLGQWLQQLRTAHPAHAPPEALPSASGISAWFASLNELRILQLATLAILPCWVGTLLIGQHTLMQIALVVAAYRVDIQHFRGAILCGAMLALATILKILPVVFILPYCVRRQYQVVIAYAVIGLTIVFGLGGLFFGPEKNWEFHWRWFQFVSRGPEGVLPDPRIPRTLRGSLRNNNQSVETVLARLLMDVPIHHRDLDAPHVNVLSLPPQTWRMLSTGLLAGCMGLAVFAVLRCEQLSGWYSRGQVADTQDGDYFRGQIERLNSPLGMLSLLSVAQFFISPIIWSHYFVWIGIPLAYLLSEARFGRTSGLWIYVIWTVTIPTIGLELCRAVGLQLWLCLVLYIWLCWPVLQLKRGLSGSSGIKIPAVPN